MRRALTVLLLAGLAEGCNAPPAPPIPVEMSARAFAPPELVIHAGDTVEWRNSSDTVHDVASRGGESFDSGAMAAGERYRRRFPTAGRFPYICSLHAEQGMKGVIVVLPKGG
jgi:plastocyanin